MLCNPMLCPFPVLQGPDAVHAGLLRARVRFFYFQPVSDHCRSFWGPFCAHMSARSARRGSFAHVGHRAYRTISGSSSISSSSSGGDLLQTLSSTRRSPKLRPFFGPFFSLFLFTLLSTEHLPQCIPHCDSLPTSTLPMAKSSTHLSLMCDNGCF